MHEFDPPLPSPPREVPSRLTRSPHGPGERLMNLGKLLILPSLVALTVSLRSEHESTVAMVLFIGLFGLSSSLLLIGYLRKNDWTGPGRRRRPTGRCTA